MSLSPDLLEGLMAHSREAIFISDLEGRLLQVNPAFRDITGFSSESLLGDSSWLTGNQPEGEAALAQMLADIKSGGIWEGEIANRLEGGRDFKAWLRLHTVTDAEGAPRLLGQFRPEALGHLAERREEPRPINIDPLTGLPNRILFEDRLQQALTQSRRTNQQVAVMLVGLDRFPAIQGKLGTAAGQALLKSAGGKLTECLRQSDSVARVGAENFALLLTYKAAEEEGSDAMAKDAVSVIKKVFSAFAEPIPLGENSAHPTLSVGIALGPQDGESVWALFRNAEKAMDQAEKNGVEHSYSFFSAQITEAARKRFSLEKRLRRGLEREELELHYQPQVDLGSGKVIGVEALVRWRDPERGLISPGEFIPLAEETGLIVPMGEWVLNTAVQQVATWRVQGLEPVRMGVNISAVQFKDKGLPDRVEKLLGDRGIDPRLLDLEITESSIMEDMSNAIAILNDIRDQGVHLSIDDFGTGYSSLSYLKQFPVKTLKIDRAFIRPLGEPGGNPESDLAIVQAIISMAHSLKLDVIAEGLETTEQLALLRQLACNEMQGFLFSKPLPEAEITRLLKGGKRLE